MTCDLRLANEQQTLSERKKEIYDAIQDLCKQIAKGKVNVVIGPQGAIAFVGWSEPDRKFITDSCAYRRIMATGTTAAKTAIMRAEQSAGRQVNFREIAHGTHSHDGGKTWSRH